MIDYNNGERLRYLNIDKLENTQNLYLNYYQEVIQSYGIDVVYFRKDNSFFTPVLSGSTIEPYIYGEDTIADFNLSGEMIIYLQISTDTLLLDAFNIRSESDGEAYITIPQFQYQFQDILGEFTTEEIEVNLSGNIENFKTTLTKIVSIDNIPAKIEIPLNLSGDIPIELSAQFEHIPVVIDKNVKAPFYFHENWRRHLIGTLRGINNYDMDENGNGSINTTLHGDIGYFKHKMVKRLPNTVGLDIIKPQAGDFFRLKFEDLEYEITEVRDRALEEAGLNPLLSKYMWKCSVVRRQPSYENVVGGQDKEPNTPTNNFLTYNDEQKEVVKQIFNYEEERVDKVDGKNSDTVYGGF